MFDVKPIYEFSATEIRVLHAAQDAEAEGLDPTPATLAFRVDGVDPKTVRRTACRLAGWGLVRRDGTRADARGLRAGLTEAEVEAAKDAVRATREDVLVTANGRWYWPVRESVDLEDLLIEELSPLDRIISISAAASKAEACRDMIALFPG